MATKDITLSHAATWPADLKLEEDTEVIGGQGTECPISRCLGSAPM